MNSNNLPNIGFLRLEEILHFIPVGRTTWWNGVKSGRFPSSIKLGPRTTAWRAQDIQRLIEQYSESGCSSNNGLSLSIKGKSKGANNHVGK